MKLLSERNIIVFIHLVTHFVIMAIAYGSVDTSQRWYEATQFAVIAFIIIALVIIYFIGAIVSGIANKKELAKTLAKLIWVTPLFWIVVWYGFISISNNIDTKEREKYIAESDRHYENYLYTHQLLQKKFPKLLPDYKLLNPGIHPAEGPFKFLTPYGDTISVTDCIGCRKKSNEYSTTRIRFNAPGKYVQDTAFIMEKTIQFLNDFSNDSTLKAIDGKWLEFIQPEEDHYISDDRLTTRFDLGKRGSPEFMGYMSTLKFNREEEIRYRLIIFNANSKLCIPVEEKPIEQESLK